MKARKIISAILALCLIVCLFPQTIVTAAEVTGNFTVAAVNVNGLPASINANSAGPVGSGMIGTRVSEGQWDIVGLFEDYAYNSELVANLGSNFSYGRTNVVASKDVGNADGINLVWKNTISVTGESITPWSFSVDTRLSKGFRFYVAEVAPGVSVDVYLVNNEVDGHILTDAARIAQVSALLGVIKNSSTKNPIIILGGFNSLYTNTYMKSMLVDELNKDSRFTVFDAWVENANNHVYPERGSDPLTPVDKGGSYQYPQAEVSEKILFINNSESDVQLSCYSYYVSQSFVGTDGSSIVDDWPVVAQITYTKTVPDHVHSYELVEEDSSCMWEGYRVYECECGDYYEETIPAPGHDYVTVSSIDATCEEDGVVTVECARCGWVKRIYTDAIGHNYQITENVPSACLEKGHITYECSNCHDTYTEMLPMLSHNYVYVGTTPGTCTSPRYEDYECSICGETLHAAYEYGHTFVSVGIQPATCEDYGWETYSCTNCDHTYSVQYAQPLGHSFFRGTCERCGEADPDFVATNDPFYVLDQPATSISSEKKYAIMFPTTKLYVLSHNDNGTISNQTLPNVNVGDVSKDIVWDIDPVNGGYTISADINGNKMYLARSSSITYGGYSVRMQTTPFVWNITMRSTASFARISCSLGSSNFVLRYYSGARNWIASSKMSDICIYEVNEEF